MAPTRAAAGLATGAPWTTLQLLPNAALLDKVDKSRLVDPDTANAVEAEAAAIVDEIEMRSQTVANGMQMARY